MRILLANYRYFVSGGPERYMFNVIDALVKRGHEVVPFSIRYRLNQPTPYSHYFVQPLGGQDEVYFRDHKLTPKTILRTLSRLFYSPDVEKAIIRLANDEQPQVAYVLQYLRKLSPALLVGLKRLNIPVIARLSDFAMLCPETGFVRDNAPCELCISGNLLPSIKHRCVQHSIAASTLNVLATGYHRRMKYFDLIDVFVTPTGFMYQKMVAAGYPEERLRSIPTFVNTTVFHPEPQNENRKYVSYVGRLVPTKGVHALIDAFALLRAERPDIDLTLQIAGAGEEQYVTLLKQQVQRLGLGNFVVFLGELQIYQMARFLGNAYLSVIPSLWYENLPNALLESYACGTPVLASNLGSLAECVEESRTGYLFRPNDPAHLAERLAFSIDHPHHIAEMGRRARMVAETTYSEEQHMQRLEALFIEITDKEAYGKTKGIFGNQDRTSMSQ